MIGNDAGRRGVALDLTSGDIVAGDPDYEFVQIGRASGRERVSSPV